MFGLFGSNAKKERVEAKQTYEMVVDVLSRIKTTDLTAPRLVIKVSATSVITDSFLKGLAGVTEIAKTQLPDHCHETPLLLSSPRYLREEAERRFTAADKGAEQVGFEPFTASGTNYLLGAFILCHAWDISDQMTGDDLRKGNYSVGMWRHKLLEAISEFLIEGGADEKAVSVLKAR